MDVTRVRCTKKKKTHTGFCFIATGYWLHLLFSSYVRREETVQVNIPLLLLLHWDANPLHTGNPLPPPNYTVTANICVCLSSEDAEKDMANSALEIVGLLLTLIGLIGAAASTGMPMWRVTAFIEENIIVFETRYEGLWMNCFRQADIRMQCKVYDSLLALSPDLQAARGLMCCSLALGGLGLLIAIVGMQCTSCIQNNRGKRLVLIIAGSMVLMACLCVLIPVSWTGHVIIRDFYNPLLIAAQRRELGEALYIGWVSSAFLFAGGCMFICCNLQSEGKGSERYMYSRDSNYMAYTPQPLQPQQLVLLPQPQPQLQPQPQPQPMLSRHPSTIYTNPSGYNSGYNSRYPSRYPSVHSGVAYLWTRTEVKTISCGLAFQKKKILWLTNTGTLSTISYIYLIWKNG